MSDLPQKMKNLAGKEAREVEDYFNCKATQHIRRLLVEVLEQQLEIEEVNSTKRCKYEMAGWSEYQADSIGYKRGLREVIKLIK